MVIAMKNMFLKKITMAACLVALTSGVLACGNSATVSGDVAANSKDTVNIADSITAKAAKPGTKVSFQTYDMNIDPVDSETLFGSCDITMVNMWATWCGFCVGELPELEALNQRLAGYNCQVVGVLIDGYEEDSINEGIQILNENGVTYTNLLPFEGMDEYFPTDDGVPVSFFVNSKGEIIGDPIEGAYPDLYEPHIQKLLEAEGSSVSVDYAGAKIDSKRSAAKVAAKTAGAYKICVVDKDNNPVEGAMVQFCTDTTCKMLTTDENGIATFEEPAGVYSVHILKAPSGYAQDKNEYKTDDKYTDVTITLEKG